MSIAPTFPGIETTHLKIPPLELHATRNRPYIHTYITLHYIPLHYITLRYVTLHYITFITLHYMTLHDIT